MDLTNFKFNLKQKLQYFFSEIFPLIAILFLMAGVIGVFIDGFSEGAKIGESAGIKQTTINYQKDLIDRNLAVYDELTGKWTILDSNQIVNNLIKHKKININSFTPIGVSGIRECNCNSSKNTNNDELFDLKSIENFDINKTALNKSKNKSPKISKK